MAIPRNLANLAPRLSTTGGSFSTTIGVGGATPSASGAGITFPASQSASTDVNTLDDYEEGTFTMSLQSIQSGSLAFGGAEETLGIYTKVGKMVHIVAILHVSSQSSPSGDIRFQGLPFQSASGYSGLETPIVIQYPASGSVPGNASSAYFNLNANSTSNLYCYFADTDQTPCGAAFARTSTRIHFNFTYETN